MYDEERLERLERLERGSLKILLGFIGIADEIFKKSDHVSPEVLEGWNELLNEARLLHDATIREELPPEPPKRKLRIVKKAESDSGKPHEK